MVSLFINLLLYNESEMHVFTTIMHKLKAEMLIDPTPRAYDHI